MKLLIIGHGRHGKDTVAEIISDNYHLQSTSSSMVAARTVVIPWLKRNHGLTYKSVEDAYEDRVNHRSEWYNAISEYNEDDPSRLCEEILAVADIYIGMRSDREFYASRHLFDYVIGVTSFHRVKKLDPTFVIPLSECDYILTNDETIEDLEEKTIDLMESLQ